MKSINLNLGVEEYLLAGKVAVAFNPTDMTFLERLSRAFSELDALQEEVRSTREKLTDDREVFPIARELDGKMRAILNELFGKEICEPLFGSVNLFASSGGLPLWANLLLAITDIERPSDSEAAITAFVSFADPRGSGNKEKPHTRLISWSQDFDLMVAPINHILNTECRSLPYLHWRTFLAAYLEIPPESVFARVLRIREKLRTGKKLEKYERSWYNRNRDLVHLKPKFSKKEEELIEAWT